MSSPVPLAELAEFDPPVAAAVVAVLRRAGLPARVGGGGRHPDELAVLVPAERRDEALAAMASSMEAIHAELARAGAGGGGERTTAPGAGADRTDRAASTSAEEDEEGGAQRPLVFERLRSLGFLPVLLVPLLVVTLSQTRLPAVYAAAVIIGGGAAIIAWRDGRRRRD